MARTNKQTNKQINKQDVLLLLLLLYCFERTIMTNVFRTIRVLFLFLFFYFFI